jgi:hypothetical protein
MYQSEGGETMSDSKPTPGPWQIDERFPGSYAIEPTVAWLGASSGHQPGENLANARLIAAAPDLYHALWLARSYAYKTGMSTAYPHEWEKMNTALAKAKGEL